MADDASKLRKELNFIWLSSQDLTYYQAVVDSSKKQEKGPDAPNPLGLDKVSTALSGTDKDFEQLDEVSEPETQSSKIKTENSEIIPLEFEE